MTGEMTRDPRINKVVVLIGDGMADLPIEALGGATPLEAVETLNMDALARAGAVGLSRNVPPGMEPGSDVAIMSIMGYDPGECYTGRGPIEAASIGARIPDGFAAFRCNLITIDGETLHDYSGGHISTEESGELISALKSELDSPDAEFIHGVSFRNLLMARGDFSKLRSHAPHDHLGERWADWLPSGPGADALLTLMEESRDVLEYHEINKARKAAGKQPANMIWPWSGGGSPSGAPYSKKFGLSGAVISAVDLVQGLGVIAGLEIIKIPGATGMVDTNYEGKTEAALEALERLDFVLVHVEGIDEAAHMADLEMKMEGIRRFDRLVVGPIAEHAKERGDCALLVLPDHPTPISIRTHTSDPVPFIAAAPGIAPCGAASFSEKTASASGLYVPGGHNLLELLISGSIV
ncbi:MAG TPA: cofactor-independent phosphoglycerate mutase [bacterium]|nr:cofactor-independent phosphoglycerate mutase [bacterium]